MSHWGRIALDGEASANMSSVLPCIYEGALVLEAMG